MLIRDHSIYYVIVLITIILARLLHPVFYLFALIALLFLVYKTHYLSLIVIALFVILLNRPNDIQPLEQTIHGKVIDKKSNAVILKSDQGLMKAYTDENFDYNDEVVVKVYELKINSPQNENSFNEALYLKANRIHYKVAITSVISRKSHFSLAKILERSFSQKPMLRSYQNLFLLGVKDSDIVDDYSKMSSLSIVHMFALSGMHVSILYHLLFSLLGLILQKNHASFVSKVLLGLYVYLIPYSLSLHRSYNMLIGYTLFKKYLSQLDVLSLLAMFQLLLNPYVIYSVSFVFSYFIYLNVLLLKEYKCKSLLVYLASIPIMMYLNYSIHLLAFLFIFLLEPFVSVFYTITLLSVLFPLAQPLLQQCLFVFHSIMNFLEQLKTIFVFQKPNFAFIVLYYYFYYAFLFYIKHNRKKQYYLCALLSLCLAFGFYSHYKIYAEIGMINVGQGDCSYIFLPYNQGNILIDTGGNLNYDIATKVVIPFLKSRGINKLDYVYISHYDYDHSGALDSLRKHFRVGQVIDSYEKTRKIGDLSVKMLKTSEKYHDKNDQSLVLYMALYHYYYLFTGDISANAEYDLYQKYGKLKVDVLKVAHHGSPGSSSVPFFEMVHPTIAFIGVGVNHYGHPSPVVLNRLNQRGIKVLRTDKDGNFYLRDYHGTRFLYK